MRCVETLGRASHRGRQTIEREAGVELLLFSILENPGRERSVASVAASIVSISAEEK